MTNKVNEIVNTKFAEENNAMVWEVAGYAGLALTILGQVVIGVNYLGGQGCWLVANALYLSKAYAQDLGRAEMVRNVAMSALTAGLMVAKIFGAF